MNISDIITKCYILALIIRDDGERLLLGDGFYEFKEQLQHFQPNIFQNDVIELQGTDGQLLAGQVRRGATQSFDGYIADSTISREATEEHRQRFLGFFLKKHHYKVVYVFPDGSAIKRERGYIVDAPSVPEMFQRFPEFHVGLNFEDVNYYEYEEGEDGDEIYAHVQSIAINGYVEGGLVWDNYGAVTNSVTWVDYALKTTADGFAQITDGVLGAPLNLEQLLGNTTQTTLSGVNMYDVFDTDGGTLQNITVDAEGWVTCTINNTSGTGEKYGFLWTNNLVALQTNTTYAIAMEVKAKSGTGKIDPTQGSSVNSQMTANVHYDFANISAGQTYIFTQKTKASFAGTNQGLRTVVVFAAGQSGSITFRLSVLADTSITPQTFTYQPFTGNVPSPNPDYPQSVNVVSGAQTVKITGKNILPDAYTSQTVSTVVFTKNSDGSITANGTASGTAFYTVADDFVLDAGTYTLSSTEVCPSNAYLQLVKKISGSPVIADTNGLSRKSFTLTERTTTKIYFRIQNGATVNQTVYPQVEYGIVATPTYEPYQGQSYEINLGGTNLLSSTGTTPVGGTGVSITRNNDGTYTVNGTASSGGYIEIGTIDFKQGQTYTISGITGWTATTLQLFTISDTAFPLGYRLASYNGPTTQTALGDETCVVRLYVYQGTTYNNVVVKPQVQLGSQATPYVPYTTYQYELCKIGTYQDSIYKSGDKWYKHAEIGKVVLDGTEDGYGSTGSAYYKSISDALIASSAGTLTPIMSDYYTSQTPSDLVNGTVDYGISLDIYVGRSRFRNKDCATTSAFKTWLGNNPTTVYYALATPTDTKITDQTLIQELSTIKALVGETDNIWLIPSSGAQGEMEVRYSRGFINQGAGYVWDAAQGGGPNVVSVDGIDRTGFVWEVVGPATNPTLTNITTNQTMTFEGDVAAGQTLTVNTSDQTAEIAGTNVFAQMEGDWMQLAPGNNVITYTATGATESSKIKWNGVVG